MKNLIFTSLLFLLGLCSSLEAQVYSPQLVGHYGVRIIYYPNGYYQGNVSNGVAHGVGTFYFSDGSFYHGGYSNGWVHGQGVIVSPFSGYLSGCWSGGVYLGQCQNYNRYDNNNEIQSIVNKIQQDRPSDSRYTSVSPEGYKIKRIDAETQMGKTLLGRYSGN